MKIAFDSSTTSLEEWQQAFAKAGSAHTLVKANELPLHEIEALLVWRPERIDWRGAQGLKTVFGLGAGTDGLLDTLQLPAQAEFFRLEDAGMRQAMADYVHYAVLHFQRGFDEFHRAQAHKHWLAGVEYRSPAELSVGVLGLGSLGKAVAKRLADNGYQVSAWSRSRKDVKGVASFAGEEELGSFLQQAHMLVNLLPLNDDTRQLLNHSRLAALPKSGVLISVSRGPIVDEDALLTLLDEGHLRGAFMDVFACEPLPAHHRLWQHPKVWITPHESAPTLPLPAAREILARLKAKFTE